MLGPGSRYTSLAWGNETKDPRGEVVLQPRSGLRDSWMRILTLKKGDPKCNRDCLFVRWALKAGTRALVRCIETKTAFDPVRRVWILTLKGGVQRVMGVSLIVCR